MDEKELAKKRLAIFSLSVSVFLVIVKTFVAYLSNSLGVYSEALNNLLDIVTVLITFLAIRMSTKPPDKDHPYGHGKYENFSAFLETIIIGILCFFIIYKSIVRIITKDYQLNINIYVFIVLIISIILNVIRVAYIWIIANKYNSPAFKADLINYSGDILSSIIVILGLVFAKYGISIADPIASIIVSLLILFFGVRFVIKTVRNLLGYVPEELTNLVEKCLDDFEEIQKINSIKIQEVGNINFININLSLKSSFHLSQVEKIKAKIKDKLLEKIPDSEIFIETSSSNYDSNLEEKIKEIVLNESKVKDIHNIIIMNIKDELHVSIHIELGSDIKLAEAEEITKRIEDEIKKISSDIDQIYIHIEVENNKEEWKDITKESEIFIDNIKECVKDFTDVNTCHNFTILFKDGKYNISFHCRFSNNLDISEVHRQTTEIENKIKSKLKNIEELTIHAEPM